MRIREYPERICQICQIPFRKQLRQKTCSQKCGSRLVYPNPAKDEKERARRWYAANREYWKQHVKEYNDKRRPYINKEARRRYHGKYRDSKIAKTYGVTKEEAQKWLAIKQCEICGNTTRRLVIDHQHGTTGKVRGRLCTNCNSGLGQFKDNPDTLIKAAQYLRDRTEKVA